MGNINDIKTCTDGALPLLAALIDKIDIAQIIDSHIEENQEPRKVSTGKAIKALIMNIVDKRQPLYKVRDFYKDKDTGKLFGEKIKPDHFTDDLMERALDELHAIGAKKVLTEVAMNIINKFNIKLKSMHADTTAKNLYGRYDKEEEGAVKIKRGHSKDYRPDLKQILFGLGVTNERVVVIGNVCDGNTSDKDWNKDILKEMREYMKKYGLKDFIYVADCALVTEESLQMLCGDKDNPAIPFVTRLPGNYNLEQELKERAFNNPNGWQNIGKVSEKPDAAEYKVQSFTAELYGKEHKFLVFYSSQLSAKKNETIELHIKQEDKRLKRLVHGYEKQKFYCEKDAVESLEGKVRELKIKYHELKWEVEGEERKVRRKGRGRPQKGETCEIETIYRCKVKFYRDEQSIREEKDRESLFVLIAGNIEDRGMTEKDILKEYKEQSSVETCFRVLKDPDFIDELYVKTPHRVEALAYVMLMALMVLTLLERNVRENMKDETDRITVSGNRKTHKPTGVSIVEALEKVQVKLVYDAQSGKCKRYCKLDDNLKRLIRLAGFDETIYTGGDAESLSCGNLNMFFGGGISLKPLVIPVSCGI